MDFRELTPVEIERLAAIVGPEHVLTGDHIPDDYSRDELGDLRRRPSVVVEPGSAAEISRIMAFASEHVIPVTVRGPGTGLCGGCVPERGGILLLTTRLNRILEIDTDNLTADRKSTRLNSSHVKISYAVFCLKKKKKQNREQ